MTFMENVKTFNTTEYVRMSYATVTDMYAHIKVTYINGLTFTLNRVS